MDTGASKIFFHKKSSVLVLQPSEIPFFICTASEKVCQWKERRVYWPEALPVGAESFPHIMLRLDENSEVTVLLPRCSQNPLQVSSLIVRFHHFKKQNTLTVCEQVCREWMMHSNFNISNNIIFFYYNCHIFEQFMFTEKYK